MMQVDSLTPESETALRDPTDSDGAEGVHLLVSLPALNEEMTIDSVIRAIPRAIPGVRQVDVLVIDDGSTDGTSRLAREAGARVIRHSAPRGVGFAFHRALAHAIEIGADLVVSIDADGQFDSRDIPKLVRPVLQGEADFVTASRFKDPELVPVMPRAKLWGNRMMSRLVSKLTGERFFDVSCGMRCYSRKALLQLHLLGRFTYTQEVFLNLAFKNLRIVEVPVAVRGERSFGESRVASNLLRYAWQTSQIIFRCYRDYHPLRFFGSLALALMLPALGLGAFLVFHYLQTGGFSPYKWTGFASAALLLVAMLIAQIAVIGDMLNRHRVYLEEVLYRQRRQPQEGEYRRISARASDEQ